MKVDYLSDPHLNHWMLWDTNQIKWEKRTRELTRKLIENGNGEVLIIAGDFGEWNCQALWMLDEVSKSYERVYFTYGNHDLYLLSKSQKNKYGDSLGRINELIELASKIDNVVPLEKNIDVYKGKTFAGDVMWYLPKTYTDWEFFNNVSNDSSYIKVNGYTKEDAMRFMWKESMDWYDTLEKTHFDIFVSHVPPVHNPFTQYEPNTCYMVDVPYINTKHWICGHDHVVGDFEKAGTEFHMNSIGYPDTRKYKKNTIPNDEIHFTVKTFEI